MSLMAFVQYNSQKQAHSFTAMTNVVYSLHNLYKWTWFPPVYDSN